MFAGKREEFPFLPKLVQDCKCFRRKFGNLHVAFGRRAVDCAETQADFPFCLIDFTRTFEVFGIFGLTAA
jgi:hypothetical protein